MGGVRQADGHHTRHVDVTVQGDHRDVIDRTDSGARPFPVARVDLEKALAVWSNSMSRTLPRNCYAGSLMS